MLSFLFSYLITLSRLILCRRYRSTVLALLWFVVIAGSIPPVQSQDSTRSSSSDTLYYEADAITIRATRINAKWSKQPVALFTIDSVATQSVSGSVADILSMQAPLFLKNYGPGAIATLSQRGLGAHQTQVLWEGMELNHPMLGVVDLSLLPGSVVSSIEMGGGNPSSAYGSGSLGGTVYMRSNDISDGVSLAQSWSQLGNYTTQVQGGISSSDQRWAAMVSASYTENQNDFKYLDPISRDTKQRDHNEVNRQHFLAKVNHSGDLIKWTTIWWWNRADQEVPGSVVAGNNDAEQHDEFLRGLIRAQWYSKGLSWQAELGASRVQLDYFQPNAEIDSRSASMSGKATLQTRKYVSDRWQWKAIASLDYLNIDTNNYPEHKYRAVSAFQYSSTWNPSPKWSLYPAVRIDHYTDFGWAVSPSLGITYEWVENRFFGFVNGSRNFNAPTFNDLYWEPGGDPQLQPERSYQLEIGGRWLDPQWGKHQISGYRMWIENGIQWLPGAGGVFLAQNIKDLIGYGIEWTSDIPLLKSPLAISYHHRGTWTRTEIDKARFSGDQAVGLLLPYVPEFNLKEQIRIAFRKLQFSGGGQWVSTRYTTEDHLRSLDPYWVWSARVAYRHTWKLNTKDEFKLQAGLEVQNLMDKQYQVVEYYPMPGRYITASIRISL